MVLHKKQCRTLYNTDSMARYHKQMTVRFEGVHNEGLLVPKLKHLPDDGHESCLVSQGYNEKAVKSPSCPLVILPSSREIVDYFTLQKLAIHHGFVTLDDAVYASLT